MSKFVESKKDNLEYYISFHSYGQYIFIPQEPMASYTENFEMQVSQFYKLHAKYRLLTVRSY